MVCWLVEEESLRLAEECLCKEDTDLLAALEFAHLAFVEFVVNIETLEENCGVGFCAVAVFVADDALELAETHAVSVSHFRLLIDGVTFCERCPERCVAHDDGVDNAESVVGELILTQDAELAGADDGAFLRVEFAGEYLHEGGFTGAVGASQTVTTTGNEGSRDIFKENFGAIPHGYIADTDHEL